MAGSAIKHKPNYWTKERVLASFLAACEGHELGGELPTQEMLTEWSGDAGLAKAITRQFGTMEKFANVVGLRVRKRGFRVGHPAYNKAKEQPETKPKSWRIVYNPKKRMCRGCHWRRDGREVCVLPRCFARMGG